MLEINTVICLSLLETPSALAEDGLYIHYYLYFWEDKNTQRWEKINLIDNVAEFMYVIFKKTFNIA